MISRRQFMESKTTLIPKDSNPSSPYINSKKAKTLKVKT